MHSRRMFLFGGFGVAAAGSGRAADAALTVFAAASLQGVLEEVGAAFTRRTGLAVRFSFAGSQALARQLDQGAPADAVVSADLEWMNWLAERRRIVAATRRDIVSNRLVIIAPVGSRVALPVGPNMPLARALGGGRLALADPGVVPAGKYAKASLTRLGVWPSVEARLAPSDNVRGSLAFVARGETPLGIVYASDAAMEPKVRVVATLPEATHPLIVYPAAVTASARRAGEAASFIGFLQGAEAQAIFRRTGFTPLKRPA